ncbi:MAG: hypothetical protein PVG63_00660 [Anaerolineales bacterium]
MPLSQHIRRNSLRLSGFDYTRPGGHFVTIKTFRGEPTLGKIMDGYVYLTN